MGLVCFGFFVVLVAGIAIGVHQAMRTAAAQKAYQESLEQLKATPNDPEIRQQTLLLGRVYSQLSGSKNGRTVFDEVALKNDIDAACAGAVNVQGRTIENRLSRLQQLHEDGHIDDAEYIRRRQKILDDI